MESKAHFRSLKKRSEIDLLFRCGHKFSIRQLMVIYNILPNTGSRAEISYVVTVSKKRVPLATGRNRIKRLMREAFRANAVKLAWPQQRMGIAFVFLSSSDCEFGELSDIFTLALQKIVNSSCGPVSRE